MGLDVQFVCSTPFFSGVVWYGVAWCGVVWCGVLWCVVVWCGVVWCGVVWCGVVWCGVVWCGVVWCGVVWCGVVWCVVQCDVWCNADVVCGICYVLWVSACLCLVSGVCAVRVNSNQEPGAYNYWY